MYLSYFWGMDKYIFWLKTNKDIFSIQAIEIGAGIPKSNLRKMLSNTRSLPENQKEKVIKYLQKILKSIVPVLISENSPQTAPKAVKSSNPKTEAPKPVPEKKPNKGVNTSYLDQRRQIKGIKGK